jgi:hypothetical protein
MISATKQQQVEWALEYANYGWRVVVLHSVREDGACTCRRGNRCETPGKHPRLSEWQKQATTEEDTIIKWWEKWPDANVGIQMGRASGIVDFEVDSPEEEAAFQRLFDNEPPPTAIFKSSRGKHRLFKWRNDLPGGGSLKVGLVVRIGNNAKGCQSVFPPSGHASGTMYTWLVPPSECEIAEIPKEVVTRMWNCDGEGAPDGNGKQRSRDVLDKPVLRESVDERDNSFLSFACREAGRSPNIDDPQEQADLYAKLQMANTAKCRPPLSDADLQRLHKQAINYTRKDRDGEGGNNTEFGYTIHGLKYEDGAWRPGEWKLVIVQSDPVEYQLHVPRWQELTADGAGVISLQVGEFRSHEKVAHAVQAATQSVILDDIPRFWPAVWNGSPGSKKDKVAPSRGLKALLVDEATYINAPPIRKRYIVVAEMFEEKLSMATVAREPNQKKPVILEDGTIWFRWQKLWKEALSFREVERDEPPELAARLGITEKDYDFHPKSGHRIRYCVFKPEHRVALTELISTPQRGGAQSKPSIGR